MIVDFRAWPKLAHQWRRIFGVVLDAYASEIIVKSPDSHFENMSRTVQIDQTGCSSATGLMCSTAKWANHAGEPAAARHHVSPLRVALVLR